VPKLNYFSFAWQFSGPSLPLNSWTPRVRKMLDSICPENVNTLDLWGHSFLDGRVLVLGRHLNHSVCEIVTQVTNFFILRGASFELHAEICKPPQIFLP
jgi:hypothetical protein